MVPERRPTEDRLPTHDVIVVGGGIVGAGIAQGCAARGWSVLLLEASSPAAGTSSRSSKLIHGGLRYLETGQLGLVRESLRERAILTRVAPSLVRLVPFHIPVYRDSARGPLTIRAGLSLYSLLGGLRPESRFVRLDPEALTARDGLTSEGLRAVYRYQDGQTDDAALTRAVLSSARSLGAEVRIPAELEVAEQSEDRVRVRFSAGEGTSTATAPVVVLATGPWANELRALCHPTLPPLPIELVQGTHIECPGEIAAGIYYLEAADDRRPFFVMPWRGRTLIGTTERRIDSIARCAPTEEEIEYLRRSVAARFPGRDTEVLEAWAGARVLESAVGSANRRSREAVTDQREESGSAIVTIAGGKLTGYRALAEERIRAFAHLLPRREQRARTSELPLSDPEPEMLGDLTVRAPTEDDSASPLPGRRP
ncbi:MAG: FAD-dependent oxidoreductase [Planctomycetota bacterium]